MSLFNHPISFNPIDPLGDGLREDIEAEQREPEAIIALEEEPDDQQLADYWQQLVEHDKQEQDQP